MIDAVTLTEVTRKTTPCLVPSLGARAQGELKAPTCFGVNSSPPRYLRFAEERPAGGYKDVVSTRLPLICCELQAIEELQLLDISWSQDALHAFHATLGAVDPVLPSWVHAPS